MNWSRLQKDVENTDKANEEEPETNFKSYKRVKNFSDEKARRRGWFPTNPILWHCMSVGNITWWHNIWSGICEYK